MPLTVYLVLTAQDHKKLPNALCSFWGKIALGPVARNWEYKAVLTSLESTALSYAIKSGEGTTRKLYFLGCIPFEDMTADSFFCSFFAV